MAKTDVAEQDIAGQLVAELREDGIDGMRPVHAWGIGATGSFLPSDVAASYCKAAHFVARSQGGKPVPVPVTARFSNGSGTRKNNGAAGPHDGWSDVRGMAVRFHLPDGKATDLIAMTLNCFFTRTPEAFRDFAVAAKPAPCRRENPWRKILDLLRLTLPMPDPYPGQEDRPDEGAMRFADQNPYARLPVFQAASIGAPVSYVRATYHAVHTFVVTGQDGTRRWVRFTWQPIAGALNIRPEIRPGVPNPDYAGLLSTPYLKQELTDRLKPPPEQQELTDRLAAEPAQQELRDRLAAEPARFSLMMTIGEIGDDFDNSTVPWPPHRIRVEMGTLSLDRVADVEKLSFNPGLLTDGIDPSGDPVLWVRKQAYIDSSKARDGICPFARTPDHGG